MGKLHMGKTKTPKKLPNQEIIYIEKEVPVEKIVEKPVYVEVPVDKIVEKEVPVYVKDDKDLSQFYELIVEENEKYEQEINDIKKAINNLGESSAESFTKVIDKIKENDSVINNQGAVIIALQDCNNKKSEKLQKIEKEIKIQKYINYGLILGLIVSLLI